MLWPMIGPVLASSGHRAGQGDQMLSPLGGPTLEEQSLVPQVRAVLSSSPVADTTEETLLQVNGLIWHLRWELWSFHV